MPASKRSDRFTALTRLKITTCCTQRWASCIAVSAEWKKRGSVFRERWSVRCQFQKGDYWKEKWGRGVRHLVPRCTRPARRRQFSRQRSRVPRGTERGEGERP